MITTTDMRTYSSFLSRCGPLEGMRNAKNPARSYLHQAYLHVRHLSCQDRLERYPRSIAEGPALLGVSGVLLGERRSDCRNLGGRPARTVAVIPRDYSRRPWICCSLAR